MSDYINKKLENLGIAKEYSKKIQNFKIDNSILFFIENFLES